MDEFDIGDQVLKHTGDYRIPGEIRSKFQLYDGGPVRYVVRHEGDRRRPFLPHLRAGQSAPSRRVVTENREGFCRGPSRRAAQGSRQ